MFLLFFAGNLTLHQCAYILRGISTYESLRYSRYEYLKDASGNFFNPFDRGWLKNLLPFLGCLKPLDIKRPMGKASLIRDYNERLKRKRLGQPVAESEETELVQQQELKELESKRPLPQSKSYDEIRSESLNRLAATARRSKSMAQIAQPEPQKYLSDEEQLAQFLASRRGEGSPVNEATSKDVTGPPVQVAAQAAVQTPVQAPVQAAAPAPVQATIIPTTAPTLTEAPTSPRSKKKKSGAATPRKSKKKRKKRRDKGSKSKSPSHRASGEEEKK